MRSTPVEKPDVILIGSGIMSATMGAMLKRLRPEMRIQVYEVTNEPARESSRGWNNAGTGHAGICELSYTPHREKDGTVDVTKAVDIFAEFAHTKQFWGYAAATGMLPGSPSAYANALPHISFVTGQEQVDYLRARREGLVRHHFFRTMEFSTDPAVIAEWAPLLMEGRGNEPVAATRMAEGTDVNFGNVAAALAGWLAEQEDCALTTGRRVVSLTKTGAEWTVRTRDAKTGEESESRAPFVFAGAGGGSLPLLRGAGIPETKGAGGFPIAGRWLVCDKTEIIARHHAKVYGQALGAAPTMAVPHLDTRFLDGNRALLFGPYAAWTSRFLQGGGSPLDLPRSVGPDNILTLLKVGARNADLVKYLITQGMQSLEDRMEALRIFYPAARPEDWRVVTAGIRVQSIRKIDGVAGIVHYGTEIVTTGDRSLAALLGASPGASVSTHIILQVIRLCFPALMDSPEGRERLREMTPAWLEDARLPENEASFLEADRRADLALGLTPA